MTDDVSYFGYFRERIKPLLAVLVGIIVVIAVPMIWVTDFTSTPFQAQVLWPARLSADAPCKLPISLSRWDGLTDLTGEATLYYGWAPEAADYPQAFEDGKFRELSKGPINSDGNGVLDVPATGPPTGDTGRRDVAPVPALLLRIEVDGDETWHYQPLQQTDAPVLALTIDRPLYQPGQTIKMRALVASATTGKPLRTAVTFVVRDAKSNLVMDEVVDTSASGIAATELALADRCLQGSYSIDVSAGGQSKTTNVDVRPYRLPRFKVVVTPKLAEVRPGDTVEARVVATYTYGEAVTDADIAVEASVGGIPLPASAGKTDADGGFDVALALPQNTAAGATVSIRATVTSLAGRAEVGQGSTAVAGRRAVVEVVPANSANFSWDHLDQAYVIVRDASGKPLAGAKVEIIIPETAGERSMILTTDAKGRAPFHWTPTSSRGAYVSLTVVADGAVVFKENVHVPIGFGPSTLSIDRSVVNVGETLGIDVAGVAKSAMIVLIRDGVPLAAVSTSAGAAKADLVIPAAAAGFGTVALIEAGTVRSQAPVWVRQRGGDAVDISLDQPEYRPGTQAKVTLAFPAADGAGGDPPPVTFGLVGVDEALYALKERAGVPLYILMRRAPQSIFSALSAFDGVDSDDNDGVAIATHRFRQRVSDVDNVYLQVSELTASFERHARSGWLHALAWLFLIGLIANAVQMGRWTWAAVTVSAFTWRRAGAQIAFALFCGAFAVALTVGNAAALVGGLAVWDVVVACWLIAAAVRLPDVRFGAWLTAHLTGAALLGAMAICLDDLQHGARSADFFVLQAGIVLPLALIALQWFIWAFVLMREGFTKSGLGIGSFAGILTIGLLGATLGSSRDMMAPGMAMKSERFAMEDAVAPSPVMPMPEEQAAPKLSGSAPPPPPDAPRVRSWFPETMVWIPEIASDAAGKAVVDVELPDSITTWRLNAWANTVDGRFGEGEAKLVAIQPYFVELDVPLEVIDGDRFEVPVTLVNRGADTVVVDLSAETSGPLALRGFRGGANTLRPGERSIVWMNLAAVGVGDSSVTVSSSSAAGEGDAVRRQITVKPDGRVLRNSASAIVGKGWETEVRVPRDTIDNTRFAEVRLFGSLVANALAGLESMLAYPSGCFEQTSSANYPNVMILRAMRDMTPAEWPDGAEDFAKTHAKATRLVRIGYQNILSFQMSDGGFALYPDRHSSDVMLTAYGILQLVWASEITKVDARVIERAAQWLVSQQAENGSWAPHRGVSGSSASGADIGLLRATAFVVMALTATKNTRFRPAIDKALVRIEDRLGSVESANALAFVTNALSDAGSKQLALKAADQLAALATRQGDVAFWDDAHETWMGGYGTYASRETTALAVQALLATESQQELLQPALNWIANGRGTYGGWGSTQSTVWTLRALETLRQKGNNDSTLRFYFEAQQLPTIQGATDLQVTKTPQPLRQFSFVPSSNEGRFLVDSSAETAAMVQLVSEYAVDWDSRFADVEGEAFGAELEIPSRATKRGAVTRAYVRLDNQLETAARMVIVEAPLPPGAFVPTDALDALVAGGAIDLYEVLPTHVRFYVDAVPGKQERVFAYDFVPLVRGAFSLPPLRAYPYYSPEPVTEVDAGDITTR